MKKHAPNKKSSAPLNSTKKIRGHHRYEDKKIIINYKDLENLYINLNSLISNIPAFFAVMINNKNIKQILTFISDKKAFNDKTEYLKRCVDEFIEKLNSNYQTHKDKKGIVFTNNKHAEEVAVSAFTAYENYMNLTDFYQNNIQLPLEELSVIYANAEVAFMNSTKDNKETTQG